MVFTREHMKPPFSTEPKAPRPTDRDASTRRNSGRSSLVEEQQAPAQQGARKVPGESDQKPGHS